jgi:dihydrofolate reductase
VPYWGHMISIIAALGKNRELGKQGALLWRIPEDLKRFKTLTVGHPVVMGRKTFESIGKPLPGRTNLVLSRAGMSLEEALKKAKDAPGGEEIFIIGGAQIYEQALPFADRLYLTLIEAEASDADAFFPAYASIFTKKLSKESGEFNGVKYSWVVLEK